MTAVERERRFSILKSLGCVACKIYGFHTDQVDIHHLNECGQAGRKRRGDEFTIPLCKWHHVGRVPNGMISRAAGALFGPSLAKESKRFREIFGTDDQLLEYTNVYVESRKRMNVRFLQ